MRRKAVFFRLLTFWMPLTWLLFVALCAVTAGWMPMPAPDIMDYDHQNALPGTVLIMPETTAGALPEARSRVCWLGTDASTSVMRSVKVSGVSSFVVKVSP